MPAQFQVLERGWLSANNIVFPEVLRPTGVLDPASIVDTGYHSHAAQTLHLLNAALGGKPLSRIINTHLHSDHCGGNAAIQVHYATKCGLAPDIWMPPGDAAKVKAWDEDALSYAATGQHCPQFMYTHLMQAGDTLGLGGADWAILTAGGHDMHAVMLYCEADGVLISGDALWENGYGIVFPQLEGEAGFEAVRETLDSITKIAKTGSLKLVIPGHGAAFIDVRSALSRAYSRLDSHIANPVAHAWYAVKALTVFYILEQQGGVAVTRAAVIAHLAGTRYMQLLARTVFNVSATQMLGDAVDELIKKAVLCEIKIEADGFLSAV